MAFLRSANSCGSFSSVASDFEESEFDIVKRIGSGFFSDVFVVDFNGFKYVKKTAKKYVEHAEDELDNERKILALTSHKNIVSLVAALDGSNSIILELCSFGELAMYIDNLGSFQIPTARYYAKEIASGLNYLHSKHILHNDLKAENIIIGDDGVPKLTDFGNSREIINDEPEIALTGTPESLSPEMITQKGYSFPRDWWSFGVLVYQMLVGEMPFTGGDELQVYVAILTKMPNLDVLADDVAVNLLNGLLTKDPAQRLVPCTDHLWFKGPTKPLPVGLEAVTTGIPIQKRRP